MFQKMLAMAAMGLSAIAALAAAQDDWRLNGRDQEWPDFSYGYAPGFVIEHPDGRVVADVLGIVGTQIEYGRFFREKMPLAVSLAQAKAIASAFVSVQEIAHQAFLDLDAARREGDAERINALEARFKDLQSVAIEIEVDSIKRALRESLDEEQLEQLKSLCINAAFQRIGFQGLWKRMERIGDFKMTPEQREELGMELLQMEFEMQKEIMKLRRRMWDRLISKLPPEAVEAIEVDFGIEGLEKGNSD